MNHLHSKAMQTSAVAMASFATLFILCAFGCGEARSASRPLDQVKAYTLSDGQVVVGVVIDEGQTGYLVRTRDGKTVRIEYENIVRVDSVESSLAPAASSVDPPVGEEDSSNHEPVVVEEGYATNEPVEVKEDFQFPPGSQVLVLPFKDNETKTPVTVKDPVVLRRWLFSRRFRSTWDRTSLLWKAMLKWPGLASPGNRLWRQQKLQA